MELKHKHFNKLNAIRVETLYNDVYVSVLVGTIVAFIFTYIVYGDISNSLLFSWLSLVVIGGLNRIYYRIKFMKQRIDHSDSEWLSKFHYSTCFVALLWGIFPLLTIDQIPIFKETFITLILLGLAAGGTISNLASSKTAYFYGLNIVCIFAIKVLIENKEGVFIFCLALVFFNWLIIKMVRSFSTLFESSSLKAIELEDKISLETELQQEKLKSLQASKLASLGEMAAGIAHEINNPLTVSIGNLEILKRFIADDRYDQNKFSKLTEQVIKSNRRVADIVQSMRNLSRMQDEVELEKLSVKKLISEARPLFESRLSKNNVEFICDFRDITVMADKSELSQVIVNLILNAIDAVKYNDNKKWIKILTEDLNDHYLIRVIDSGNGISEDDLAKLFEPFFTTKDVGEGTGLGLSLSRSIMERIGGKLEYDPNWPTTCFVLKIKKV